MVPAAAVLLCVVMTFAGSIQAQDTGSNVPEFILHEEKLFDDLLSNYHKGVVPANENTTVNLKLGVALINVLDVDERAGELTVNVWLRMLWNDARLTWKPEDYGGVADIRLPYDHIWRPDILLYNSARTDGQDVVYNTQVVVYHTGDILWIPPAILRSHCAMDLRNFPFDTQHCRLKFGSWTYDGHSLSLSLYEEQKTIDMADYLVHSEWQVTSTAVNVVEKFYPCCAEPYPYVNFNLTLERRKSYFMYMYAGPCVLTSLIVPFIFALPTDQAQRHVLSASLLIVITLVLSSVDYVFPTSAASDVPLLGRYMIGVHVLTTLAVILSVIVNNVANKARFSSHPPGWLKKICLSCLGRVLCVPADTYRSMQPGSQTPEAVSSEKPLVKGGAGGVEVLDWMRISVVLDRLFFVMFSVLIPVLAIACLAR